MKKHFSSATLFVALFSILFTGGCNVYLYDKERDKTGKETAEAFQKASANALFDAAATDLNAGQSAGRVAFRRLRVSRQDVGLINLIDGVELSNLDLPPPNALSPHPAQQLKRLVVDQLSTMIGGDAAHSILARHDLDISARKLEFLNETIPEKKRNIINLRKAYIREFNGTSKNTCFNPVDEPMPELAPSEDDASAKAFYGTLSENCRDLARDIGDQRTYRYFGMMQEDVKGNYGKVASEVGKLEKRAADIAAAIQAIKKNLEQLKKKYEKDVAEAKQHPNTTAAKESLKKQAKEIESFLNTLDELDPLIRKVQQLTENGVDLKLVEKDIQVSPLFVGQLVKAEFLGTSLQSLLSQAVKPEQTPKSPEEERAQAFYLVAVRTIDALSRLEDLTGDPDKLPSPNALLVAIAYERHKQETAKLDETLVTGLRQAKQAQLDAMHTRILHLWKADRAAGQMQPPVGGCGTRAVGFAQYVDDCKRNRGAYDAAARALVAYDVAQSAGADEQDASRAGNDLREQYSLALSRLNAETWLAVLKPAVDELAAYGEGGIKPETIANVLQALGLVGLGAIGWGVN